MAEKRRSTGRDGGGMPIQCLVELCWCRCRGNRWPPPWLARQWTRRRQEGVLTSVGSNARRRPLGGITSARDTWRTRVRHLFLPVTALPHHASTSSLPSHAQPPFVSLIAAHAALPGSRVQGWASLCSVWRLVGHGRSSGHRRIVAHEAQCVRECFAASIQRAASHLVSTLSGLECRHCPSTIILVFSRNKTTAKPPPRQGELLSMDAYVNRFLYSLHTLRPQLKSRTLLQLLLVAPCPWFTPFSLHPCL
ncbi:hypothetical protein K505DRAFT_69251 [Melanomma pulvis-pyrius CBS 109.77]|uniref:Uncharacterized protein n=1 Tax=Melanomma pulvis-pyrius CBS 109.77 TaxID=1314802 RepID=A0A6A6X482_9PLEO|nr:hypothetical protein K505DRAFT_69251 [Melanomma pulvis-pyrius CBS 109.77]